MKTYNWEGVNPDGYFLDKLEPIPSALPSFQKLFQVSATDVGFYVAKYVNKKSDMDLAAKGLGAKEWNNSLKTKLSLLPKKLFRIRMSRNFGMKMLTMTNLSTECLIQLT